MLEEDALQRIAAGSVAGQAGDAAGLDAAAFGSSAKEAARVITHDAYYELEAADCRGMGLLLGRLFCQQAADAHAYWSGRPDWTERLARSVPMLEATRQYFPGQVAEMEGYAEGAGLPFAELWAVSLESDLDPIPTPSARCTTVITNGGKLISHNEDYDPSTRGVVCVLKKKIGSLESLDLFYFNTLGANGISCSSRGFVQSINSLSQSDRRAEGLPRNVIARWLSETSDPRADFEKLEGLPRSSGYNHNIVRADGKIFNIEWSATGASLAIPASPFVHANNYIGPLAALDANDNSTGSAERFAVACRLARDPMSADEIEALGADRSEGSERSVLNERTVGRVIVDLENKVARIWLRDESDKGWVRYPLDFMEFDHGAA